MSTTNISFVIPAYNAAITLKESVDSIFAGNFEPGDEVLIINDASTDDTGAVILKLQEEYDGVQYIKNLENKGCPASRNVGIRVAKNTLIFNLDADNILAPGSIAVLKRNLLEQQADLTTFATYKYFIHNPNLITHYWHCKTGWLQVEDLFAGHINPGPGGNFLYTKASWERIGGYWEYGKGLHEAWGFTLKQLAAGNKLFVVPNTFYYHRHGHESLFTTESRNKPRETELLQKMVRNCAQLFPADEMQYMSNNDWYHHLEQRPIRVKSGDMGTNGIMRHSLYGYLRKVIQKIALNKK